jgi:hypothetical protein
VPLDERPPCGSIQDQSHEADGADALCRSNFILADADKGDKLVGMGPINTTSRIMHEKARPPKMGPSFLAYLRPSFLDIPVLVAA